MKTKINSQLKTIEDQGNKQLNATKTSIQAQNHQKYFSGLSPDAKQLLNEIKEEENDIDSETCLYKI